MIIDLTVKTYRRNERIFLYPRENSYVVLDLDNDEVVYLNGGDNELVEKIKILKEHNIVIEKEKVEIVEGRLVKCNFDLHNFHNLFFQEESVMSNSRFDLEVLLEGDQNPVRIDVSRGEDFVVKSDTESFPFIDHTLGRQNLNVRDVMYESARSIIGAEISRKEIRGKVVSVNLIEISERTTPVLR